MFLRDTPNSFGLASRLLHWGSALIIVAAWALGTIMEDMARGASRDAAMSAHYTLGLAVMSLVALRLLWRLANPAQAAEPGTSPAQRLLGRAMHMALYGLMVLVPLTGLLDRWARGRPVTLVWGQAVPAPFAIPGGRLWGEAHELLANLMLVAIGLHVLAALWHHLVLRDGVLRRMTGRPAGA